MSARRNFVTWGYRGALLAVAASILAGVVAAVLPGRNMGPEGSLSWFLIEVCDAIAEAGLIAALLGVHALQAHRSGRLGLAGVVVAATGTGVMVLSTVMWLLPLTDGVLLDILFNGSLLGWLLGLPLLGIATLRAGVLPPWVGVMLTGLVGYFAMVFILVDYWGEVRALLAVPWLGFALALRGEHTEMGVAASGRDSRRTGPADRAEV